MQFLVLGWLVLELTGSSIQQLGLVVFLYGIPNTILLPVGGVIADRIDRKLLLMATQLGVGVLIAVMAVLTWAEAVTLWHVYLAVALLGVLQALNQPARVTILSDLVGQSNLLDAVAQFNAAVHIGRIIGPPLAGVLIDGPPLIAQYADVWGLGAGLAAKRRLLRVERPLHPAHWRGVQGGISGPRAAGAELYQRFLRHQEHTGTAYCDRARLLLWRIRNVPSAGDSCLRQGPTGFRCHPRRIAAAGLGRWVFARQRVHNLHEQGLALSLAAGVPRDHGRLL